jgi:hypothetical protein
MCCGGTDLHDGEGTWEVKIAEFELRTVYPSKDLCGTYTSRNALKPPVHESH